MTPKITTRNQLALSVVFNLCSLISLVQKRPLKNVLLARDLATCLVYQNQNQNNFILSTYDI